MRGRMERKVIERRNVVLVDAIAQRRRVGKTGDQDARQRAQPDIDYVVVRPAAAERPACIVSAKRSQAVLRCERRGRDRQINACDIRDEHAQQIRSRRGRHAEVEYALQNAAHKERRADELRELRVV